MRRGFKTEAKGLALEIRRELGLDGFMVLDPWGLADQWGIEVCGVSELALDEEDLERARRPRASFSGLVTEIEHRQLIVENDFHGLPRRRATVSHEMSHIILEHEHPAVVTFDRKCGAGAEQEEEADWLAGELLVPWDAALRQAWRDATDDDVARRYQVSVPQARRRMNQSGVRQLVVRSRRKRAASSRAAPF